MFKLLLKSLNVSPIDQINKLRKIKESQGFSYDELGHQIGVHSMSIYRWLKRGKPPKSRALRRAVDQFLKGVLSSGEKTLASRKYTLAIREAKVTVKRSA